jgi:acyl carrier protein
MTDLETKLQDIMRRIFDQDDLEITRGLTADQVDGWDSLAHVHLVVAIEKEFGIRLKTTEILHLKCVGDLLDLIQARKNS